MALFHLSVTQTKRSAGQSAIASAAYRAGERLYSEYYGCLLYTSPSALPFASPSALPSSMLLLLESTINKRSAPNLSQKSS